MTRDMFNKANSIDHDIKVLENIKYEQDNNHWIGFNTVSGEVDSFWNSEIQHDLKMFIISELEKAQKLFDEV